MSAETVSKTPLEAQLPRRIVFVAEDITALSGGAPAVVRQLSQRIASLGSKVQLVHAAGQPKDVPVAVEGLAYPAYGMAKAWNWGRHLREDLSCLTQPEGGSAPVLHIHGIWSAPQYFAARAAYANRAPFVVTAHGMLEPWLWNQQGWKVALKKRLYWRTVAYPALRRAAVVHAITPLERDQLRRLFPDNRIEVIPNAVDVLPAEQEQGIRTKTILFLGRLEPKKGVDILIHAFGRANLDADWRAVIVGPAWSEAYLAGLKALALRLDLTQRIKFIGPVFGEQKRKLLAEAWVMAAPSQSEVVGLVNLEAAVACLPSITTPQTGLYDWEDGGGLLAQPSVEAFTNAIRSAAAWTMQEQALRGLASRRLVEDRYSWRAVLPKWLKLYNSLHR